MDSNDAEYSETLENHSDDEDTESELQGESGVQLGYIEKEVNALFSDPDWRNWDGGKVGGTPVWLNPSSLPAPKTTQCERCGQPMRFILQIYCPVEDTATGFHRSLYVFCCRNRHCLQDGSVKCLRTQLPRKNQFYCFEPEDGVQTMQEGLRLSPALCAICGCRGGLTCGQCKKVNYCSKVHQKEHWKLHKLQCTKEGTQSATSADSATLKATEEQVRSRSLFPEYTLAVEDEVFEGEDEEELKRVMQTANIWEDAVTEGGADEEADARLTQADYQRAMGSEVHDPTYINFLTRVERGGKDQVLRYCRAPPASDDAGSTGVSGAVGAARSSNGLLLLSSDKELMRKRAAALESSPCPRCGAPRTFEFQIMPQLLHYLKVDQQTRLSAPELPSPPAPQASGDGEGATDPPAAVPQGGRAFFNQSETDIDWGSLDIFTCSASCDVLSPGTGAPHGDGSAYVEELVLLQPPVYKDA